MQKQQSTLIKQSLPMICGILLDATFFVHNNRKLNVEEIREYVNIINSFIRVLKEIHDNSSIFIIVYAGKSVFVKESDRGELTISIAEAIKEVLNDKFLVNEPNLSSAMSLALTTINKDGKLQPDIQKKIIIVSTPFESSPKFIPLMNCVFAAQRIKTTIDTIVLSVIETRCTFCQQASYLTNGIYNTATLQSLFPRLLSNNTSDCDTEKIIRVTGNQQPAIDWKLWCFHCKKPLDHGYVCSSCFGIYCEKQKGRCPTCGAYFE
ncbi:hypothetical protein conserved [Entamoeba histolytica]|uniref:General transcription factor IIH subunit 3 n=3 Tax=Entamoeba histolytica TaxID=5759 RepID=C4M9E2_ENTH1|nr:hypothetical protein, conserved [Entamoeba histolytica HM-1:IMSS]EAL45004.1 hypothetical protein, conserved [Entamoeba histolytica HM-1:IMSS]ENY62622.1 RNA polymerase II transcription factor B subunit, putative [Entamoeba histolytica HM-1:IMSS-A]GAT98280.1 hypothetical protein conserved [Entamoeba histolytica]|eukprot:XP_650390.1 hypothetical protein, conserved [Entamoeba histolytica HM-1:IMSS]